MAFRPLLSGKVEDFDRVKYPVLASPKLDGIRTLCHKDYGIISRTLKLIPNQHIRDTIEEVVKRRDLWGLDGELIVGSPTAKDCFNKSTSGVMSRNGQPEFTYWVFDNFNLDMPFSDRIEWVHEGFGPHRTADVAIRSVPHVLVTSKVELLEYEERMVVVDGFEGVMLRSLHGEYKQGRSTEKEGILLKSKRFLDHEAKIVGFVERMHNANESTVNELGYTERSSHKDNKIPMGTLGALVVECPLFSEPFEVGTGFDDVGRKTIWDLRETFMGTTIKFKYQPVGVKDKPRFPVFLGFRED